MVDFHWKNDANRPLSEICPIRSYGDSLLGWLNRVFKNILPIERV